MLHILLLLIKLVVTASFRSSMCLRENEQFSLCGWKCPPTCVNIRLLELGRRCPSVWECRVGCRCSAGFIRDEYSKSCILVNQCPGSAPTLSAGQLPGIMVDPRQQDYYRDTRSQYHQYVSPCAAAAAAAAAASSPIPAIAPAAYQLNIAPYQGYPQMSQQYGAPHYRSVDMEPEIMSYSDMDHMMSEHVPVARYYAAPAASHPGYVPVASPATSSPVFGVFPNANTGGCNVPLLFSCTPSVVPGHVVHSQAQYNTAADSYRGSEPLAHHDSPENHEEPVVHEHMNPAHESSHAVHQ